jgi:hypothetical protein
MLGIKKDRPRLRGRALPGVVAGIHPKRTADVDGDRGRTQIRQSVFLAKLVSVVVPAESHWRFGADRAA